MGYRKEEKRQYYLKNREYILERSKIYKQRNQEKYKSIRYKFTHFKAECRRRNIDMNIDLKFFETNFHKDCFYCGDISDSSAYGSRMDRINSDLGYSKDNIVPCCKKCNVMKNEFTLKDFLQQIEKIYYNRRDM